MHLSDRITGGFLVALGAAAALFGSRFPAVPGQDVGPAAFPMVIGFGLVGCGALIAVGIGRGFEVPEEPEPGPPPSRLASLRVLVPPALLVFYALASEPLGFLIAGAIVVLLAAFSLGARPALAVPLAIAGPVLVHLAFHKLLRVPLPEGLLAAPW
ncbi:tripartite tricarboxylate transporter TctB family protein [Humitalea sp. 24SJ18S-53]|uniref:tripartite tricarboxylate transporter TctB family protein n=1 Tax=Humitalea sp. 24SJ18S-53 TaxID=3422307 RepID=UPI003D67E13F